VVPLKSSGSDVNEKNRVVRADTGSVKKEMATNNGSKHDNQSKLALKHEQHKIDLFALSFFPLVIAIFNIFYWMYAIRRGGIEL